MPQPGAAGDSEPFLWLGAFALCIGVHLLAHPQAGTLRDALRWLAKHPSPLLWLAGSMIVSQALTHWPVQDTPPVITPLTSWDVAFKICFQDAFKRLALIFHHAFDMPFLQIGHLAGATVQALSSAFTQIWLCCYLIGSQQVFIEEGVALKQAMERWRSVLCLAVCHLPWWWLQAMPDSGILGHWLMPEFLLFLAPLPLVIARTSCDFFECGGLSLLLWKRRWPSFLLFGITAMSLLLLLEYSLHMVDSILTPKWFFSGLILKSIIAATLHLWLFVSGALLLLGGGYVPSSHDPDPL